MPQKLYELARIVLPPADYFEHTELFVRHSRKEIDFGGSLQSAHVYKFNTWMNIFCAQKYFKYCAIENLYLQIRTDRDCEIVFSNLIFNEALANPDTTIKTVKISANTDHQIEIENPNSYENLYFTLISDSPTVNIKASWCTSSKPVERNKIAIISCTYKREAHIKRNVALFKDFINDNVNLKERLMFLVVDNGKTLENDIESEKVKLYPNNNTGGAGGFTRGIIETLKDPSFTRILLLDDDVEIFPEAFYRTIVLVDYLKPERNKSFINGAMLLLSSKSIFHENAALWTPDWVEPYHGKLDISKAHNVAKANYAPDSLFENENRKASSGWWFCSFSVQSVREKGLPLPNFIKADDIEWSWRNFPEHHISVNGIFVWHMDFGEKENKITDIYFGYRNKIFANMLHTSNYKKIALKSLSRDFRNLLWFYDYTSCSILLRAMQDIIKGSEVFEQDQEQIIRDLAQLIKSDIKEDIVDLNAYGAVKDWYDKFTQNPRYRRRLNKTINIIYKLTLFGRLIPVHYWIKSKDVFRGLPHREFFFVKRLNVYNLQTNQIEVREFNPKKRNTLKKEFKKLLAQFEKNYDAIKNDYEKGRDRFITMEFWIKYLQI